MIVTVHSDSYAIDQIFRKSFIVKNIFNNWCVLYTRPNQEKKVNACLSEFKIRSFLPLKRSLRIWKDRKKLIDMPVFPSYIFVRVENLNNYYDSLSIDGVLHFVKIGTEIACVKESLVENLKLICNYPDSFEVLSRPFQPGMKVMINFGVLTGLLCEIVKLNGKEKALVRVDLLQRNILLTLPSEYLMAV